MGYTLNKGFFMGDIKEKDLHIPEIKAPKNFEDIRHLMQLYEEMDQMIKRAANGREVLLGFISKDGTGNWNKCETLDYTWGHLFAKALMDRQKEIEILLNNNKDNSI